MLDIGPIERRDKGPPNRYQNFACNVVCLGFMLENLPTVILDRVAALQESSQRYGARHDNCCVFLEERKEPLLLGHEGLKPAENPGLVMRRANPSFAHQN